MQSVSLNVKDERNITPGLFIPVAPFSSVTKKNPLKSSYIVPAANAQESADTDAPKPNESDFN